MCKLYQVVVLVVSVSFPLSVFAYGGMPRGPDPSRVFATEPKLRTPPPSRVCPPDGRPVYDRYGRRVQNCDLIIIQENDKGTAKKR